MDSRSFFFPWLMWLFAYMFSCTTRLGHNFTSKERATYHGSLKRALYSGGLMKFVDSYWHSKGLGQHLEETSVYTPVYRIAMENEPFEHVFPARNGTNVPVPLLVYLRIHDMKYPPWNEITFAPEKMALAQKEAGSPSNHQFSGPNC